MTSLIIATATDNDLGDTFVPEMGGGDVPAVDRRTAQVSGTTTAQVSCWDKSPMNGNSK
jgi:hypothetical protein